MFLYVLLSCFIVVLVLIFFFFFKQKTAYEMRISDWSSDVCSSDPFSTRVSASGRAARRECRVRARPRARTGSPSRKCGRCRPSGPFRISRRDRKSVVEGKRLSGRVGIGGSRILKKTRYSEPTTNRYDAKICIAHEEIRRLNH